jgi:hypothetical protein
MDFWLSATETTKKVETPIEEIGNNNNESKALSIKDKQSKKKNGYKYAVKIL